MDWNLAIEKNRAALRRILAMLVAMAGLPVLPSSNDEGVRPSTLPRHVHRFVLRLLRPAEAATRRLIMVAARGLVIERSPPRIRKPNPKPILNRSNGFGTGVLIRPGPLPDWARALAPKRSSALSFPLFDPLKRLGARRRYVKQANMPRVTLFDNRSFNPLFARPRQPDPVPPPPSPEDPLDAGRLYRRLEAIGRALDDLPRQAKRLVRWQARRDASRDAAGAQKGEAFGRTKDHIRRFSPMRPGRPPGWRRHPAHEVDEVLNELHGLAIWARERPDTS